MRLLVLTLVLLVALTASADARRKHHNVPLATSAISLASGEWKLDSDLTFATVIEPLGPQEYPMIAVTCYQDVNEDGIVDTQILGPDIAYSWLDHPDRVFHLGGFDSIWKQRRGGSAVCRADLDAYPSARVLATTGDVQASG